MAGLVYIVEKQELQLLPCRLRQIVQVLSIACRQQHPLDTRCGCGKNFFLDAAYRQDQPAQTDFARHGEVVVHGPIQEQRGQRNEHRHPGAGPVLGDGTCGDMDVNVGLFKVLAACPEHRGAGLHQGERRLGGLFHHIPELPGQDQAASSRGA